MSRSFKRAFQVLLTTLFVSAMPLHAAYATADDANTNIVAQNQQACTSLEASVSPEDVQKVLDAGGSVEILKGKEALEFQKKVEGLISKPAPFQSEAVILVKPDGEDADEDAVYNAGFFVDGCLKAIMHLPGTFVEKFLKGERV